MKLYCRVQWNTNFDLWLNYRYANLTHGSFLLLPSYSYNAINDKRLLQSNALTKAWSWTSLSGLLIIIILSCNSWSSARRSNPSDIFLLQITSKTKYQICSKSRNWIDINKWMNKRKYSNATSTSNTFMCAADLFEYGAKEVGKNVYE